METFFLGVLHNKIKSEVIHKEVKRSYRSEGVIHRVTRSYRRVRKESEGVIHRVTRSYGSEKGE